MLPSPSVPRLPAGLVLAPDGRPRCAWGASTPDYLAYHDDERVARFGPRDVARLLRDPGIVRHRGKIEAAIGNARCACDLVDEAGSIAAFVWRFEPPSAERPRRLTWTALKRMATTPASTALSRELKRRGWRFVGPTTVQAFMQAMGLVDDHLEGCAIRAQCERERRRFRRAVRGTPIGPVGER